MLTQSKFEKVSYKQFEKDFEKNINSILKATKYNKDVIRQIYNNIELPSRSTHKSAGYDFKLPMTWTFKPNSEYVIPTGIRCVNMEDDTVLMMYARSGLGFKYGFVPKNVVGVIDADYAEADNEGHIMMCMVNKDNEFTIEQGKGFCQGIFQFFMTTGTDMVTRKRSGGFGSTG